MKIRKYQHPFNNKTFYPARVLRSLVVAVGPSSSNFYILRNRVWTSITYLYTLPAPESQSAFTAAAGISFICLNEMN